MKSIAIVALALLLMNIANATTESSESHMRYIIENTFETNIVKLPLVTDANCTLFENNSILLKIYIPNVTGLTFSTIEGGSQNILGTAIICHVSTMNAYPVIEDMIVQLYDSATLHYTMHESRSAINGITAADLERQPDTLANLVWKMISTKTPSDSTQQLIRLVKSSKR